MRRLIGGVVERSSYSLSRYGSQDNVCDFNAQWDRYERGSNLDTRTLMHTLPPVVVELTTLLILLLWLQILLDFLINGGKQLKIAVNKCIREGTDIANGGMGPTMTFLQNYHGDQTIDDEGYHL